MQRSAKYALVAVVVVVLGGAFGFWYFVLRDTAAPEASLTAVEQDGGSGGPTPADPNGTWTVVGGENVFVGYRIQELFGGDTLKKTATGRTPAVTGTLIVAGDQITAVDVTADMTKLKSDESRRDATQTSGGLTTNDFPTATFTLTQPITLPSAPTDGVSVDVEAVGDLTLHGVTREVTIPLQASLRDGRINVAGSADITLADYSIDPPRTPFVNVDDTGALELQLAFEKTQP